MYQNDSPVFFADGTRLGLWFLYFIFRQAAFNLSKSAPESKYFGAWNKQEKSFHQKGKTNEEESSFRKGSHK